MKKIWILAGGLVLLLVLAGGTYAYVTRKNTDQRTESSGPVSGHTATPSSKKKTSSLLADRMSQGKCEGEGAVPLVHTPMDVNDYQAFIPYGLMVDAHVTPIDHVYFSPDFSSPRDAFPVYAVADGTIVSIQHRGQNVGDNTGPGGIKSEYRIDVEHSCTFYTYFDLVTSLSPEIIQAMGVDDPKKGSSKRIPIKAGQVVGRIGGQTLDFGVYNAEVILGFITPSNYDYEPWKIHTDDVFKHFVEPIKSQIMAKNLRKVEPLSGKIDYDIDGKLIGNWFQEGTKGYGGTNQQRYWDGHLALAYDHIDPTQIRFSIGNYEGKSKQFGVKGNTPDDFIKGGFPFVVSLVHPDDIAGIIEKNNAALEKANQQRNTKPDTEPIATFEYRMRHKNGSWRWLHTDGSVLSRADDGTVKRVLNVSLDITDRKEAENELTRLTHELTQANERLRQLDKQREIMISLVSHELKTPVTAVKGFTQILERQFEQQGDQTALSYLQRMNKQIDSLTGLIQDLLDVTRIRTDRFTICKESIDLTMLVTETAEAMQYASPHHHIRLQGKINRPVIADRNRICQVVANIVSNAVKYSPPGSTVLITLRSTDDHAEVCVHDNGPGIPPDSQKQIFDLFFRVDNPKVKAVQGVGLGLYIAAGIVKYHDGDIGVRSKKGKGSTFYFTLPLKQSNA